MIKGVIFDIGGVLAYDIAEYLFTFPNCALVEKYHTSPQSTDKVGRMLWHKYAHTTEDKEEIWQEIEKDFWNDAKNELNLDVSVQDLIELSKKHIKPVEGMESLLTWLQDKQMDLLICSNNTEFFYQRQKEVAGFGEFFEKRKIILSNYFGASKSHEEFVLFHEVEKQMNFPKEEYLFVDDRKKNIEKGLTFGIPSLLFPAESSLGNVYVRKIIERMNKA